MISPQYGFPELEDIWCNGYVLGEESVNVDKLDVIGSDRVQ